MKYALLFFCFFVLKCATPKTKTTLNISKSKNIQNITLQKKYSIQTINGKDVTTHRLFIEFNTDTKQISGFSGCNNFFGNYDITNTAITIGPLASTRKMCPPYKNSVEKELLNTLQNSKSITAESDYLTLYNDAQKPVLKAIIFTKKHALTVQYTQSSRGSFKQIIVNNDFTNISTTRGVKGKNERFSKSKWKTIKNLVENFNLNNLSNLEAPSKKHQFDGAALAKLTITLNGKIYETQAFDHGNPHPEIAKVVKEILSIAQNIE